MKAAIARFLRCRSGTTAVEYALLATGMTAAIFAASRLVGTALNVVMTGVAANAT
ncbi:MAG TPA: Flp family type IVb pilin [Rhodoblastus sp.]|nr:Flp family type IVb pilin [Rhodoblastus sp.]